MGDLVGTCVGGNVGGFVSPVLVGVGVGDAVGAAWLSMCCAALSATFLSTANETVRTH